jgi:hypothetical protein
VDRATCSRQLLKETVQKGTDAFFLKHYKYLRATDHWGLEILSINQERFSGTYATWLGIPVFLNVIAGGIKTSLFCTIIGESNATVRVRIGNQWDVDIYKEMVMTVDEFSHAGYEPGH